MRIPIVPLRVDPAFSPDPTIGPTSHPHPSAEPAAATTGASTEPQEPRAAAIGRGVCAEHGQEPPAPGATPTAAAPDAAGPTAEQSNYADPPTAPRRTSRRGPTGGVFAQNGDATCQDFGAFCPRPATIVLHVIGKTFRSFSSHLMCAQHGAYWSEVWSLEGHGVHWEPWPVLPTADDGGY